MSDTPREVDVECYSDGDAEVLFLRDEKRRLMRELAECRSTLRVVNEADHKRIIELQASLAEWKARADDYEYAWREWRSLQSGDAQKMMDAAMEHLQHCKINAAQAAQNAAGREKGQPTDPRRQNPVRLPQAGTTPPAPAAPASGPSAEAVHFARMALGLVPEERGASWSEATVIPMARELLRLAGEKT